MITQIFGTSFIKKINSDVIRINYRFLPLNTQERTKEALEKTFSAMCEKCDISVDFPTGGDYLFILTDNAAKGEKYGVKRHRKRTSPKDYFQHTLADTLSSKNGYYLPNICPAFCEDALLLE